MTPLEAAKALAVFLVAGLLQVSIVTPFEVASGHPDVVLVLLVSLALLRGPVAGAIVGFWAGLVVDVAALQPLGLTSLLLTLAGYGAGRFGEATSRGSPHPPLIAVGVVTVAVVLGSAVLNFMLGQTVPASELFGAVLLPTLALNLLLAHPLYRLTRRLFPVALRPRKEAPALA